MIVNPGKFQAIILDNKGQNNNPAEINIDVKNQFWSSVLFLELEIDSKLNFGKNISKLCNKSSGQLNALNRLNRYLGFEENKENKSFIYGISTTAP